VQDVQRYGAFVLHIGVVGQGQIDVGSKGGLGVDYKRRALIAKNHTATHILNLALRENIGKCEQKGSLVDGEKLRFDFDMKGKMSLDKIKKINQTVNKQIADKLQVFAISSSLTAAKGIQSLRAVFGEKYPDPVRVVSVGVDVSELLKRPDEKNWMNYSVEFCGGTHIKNSKEIQSFTITSEEGIAQGVRRIVAVTANLAKQALGNGEALLKEVTNLVNESKGQKEKKKSDGKTSESEILREKRDAFTKRLSTTLLPYDTKEEIRALLEELSKIELQIKKAELASTVLQTDEEATSLGKKYLQKKASFAVIQLKVGGNAKALLSASQAFHQEAPDCALLILSSERDDPPSGKLAILCVVPASRNQLNAVEWVNAAGAPCGGKGGGKPNHAQGAARECSDKMKEVIEAAKDFAQKKF